MGAISSLYVELSLQAENFNNGLKAAQKEAKELEKTLKPTIQAAEDIGKAFTIAGATVVASFGAMVKGAADYGESLNKAAAQTGIATEKLSALKYVAEQEETTFETLSKGLKAMSTNANNGADAFSQLGVKTADAHGKLRPMDDILLDVAKRMSSLQDGTTKNTLASEIFGGKLGQELIPTLNRLGKEGLGPAADIVRRLGLEMSGNAAHAADDFNDSIKDVEMAMLGLSNTVAAALIPGLTDTSHGVRDAIIAVKDFTKEHETLTKAVALTGVGLSGAGGLLLGLAGFVTIYPKVVIGLKAIADGATLAKIAYGGLAYSVADFALKAIEANEDIQKTQTSTAEISHAAIMKQWDMLEKIGIVINKGRQDWDFFGMAVGAAFRDNFDAITAFNNAHKKTTDGIHTLTKAEEDAIKVEAKWRQANADLYREQVEKAAKFVDQWLNGFEVTSREADKHTEAVQRQEVATSKLADTSVDAALVIAGAMVKAHEAWDAANDKTMGSNAKLFNEINGLRETDLDKHLEYLNKRVKTEEQMMQQSINDYYRMGDEFARTFENMTAGVAAAFAGMVVHGKFSMDALKHIAQDTAQSMLSSFLKGLISPLTNSLTKLGAQLGDVISASLGIGGGVPHLPGGVAGPVLGSGGLGSIGLFGLSGAATFGIGAAVAGVALLAKHFIGQGRKKADEFVTQFQNPFGDQLADVAASGSVADLDAIWKTFNQTSSGFASEGDNQAKVVAQAHATLDPLVAQIRTDLLAREASQTTIVVNPAPSMDISQLVNEILRQITNDASVRSQLQGLLA